MTNKRRLSIVVDGSPAMNPIWPKIVSEHLDKIVRSFFGNSSQEGSPEVSLIMYTTNSDTGLAIQFINWTQDVDYFLGALRSLSFNGNAANNRIVVEGLAQSFVMLLKNSMTETEYLLGCERHCILVATGDPFLEKMRVSLPMIRGNKFVEGQLQSLEADLLDVATIFGMVGITLSIIMPKNHPTYLEIFNLGNPRIKLSPMIDYGGSEFSVLLSRNLLEGHNAMNITTDVTLPMNFMTTNLQEEPFTSTVAIGQENIQGGQNEFVNLNDQGDILTLTGYNLEDVFQLVDEPLPLESPLAQNQTLPFAAQVMERQESTQVSLMDHAPQNVTQGIAPTIDHFTPNIAPTSIAGEGFPQGLAQQANMGVVNPILPSENFQNLNFSLPMESQEPTPALLMDSAPQNVTQAITPTIDQFTPNIAPTSIAGEGFPQGLAQQVNMGVVNPILTSENFQNLNFSLPMESQEPTQVSLMDIAPQNVTQGITPTINHFTPNIALTSIAGEGFPQGLAQQANMGIVNPILTSENFRNPNFSLPQNNPYSFPVGPGDMNNTTTVGMGTINPSGVGFFQNETTHLSQSSSAPSMQVLPPNSSNWYQQHVPRYHRFEMTGIGPSGAPANVAGANNWIHPEYNQTHLLCPPPSLTDLPNFVETWQGYLAGRVHSPYQESFYFAKALKKSTSAIIPRTEWPSRLEIIIFIPKNAVNHTSRICAAPIDYMFFHMIQCGKVDLYNHMKNKSLCAKIELPYQTLILTITESEEHLLGIIFPKDTVFVEPV